MYLVKRGSPPNQAHVDIPDGLHEEEHGRMGFTGRVSHLYRSHPPTNWIRIDGPCRPRAFSCSELLTPDLRSDDDRPLEILRSSDVRVFISRRAHTMPFWFRNADGDELHFIHKGQGGYETDYGYLSYGPGDYILLPKGTTYRIVVEEGPGLSLIVETPDPISLPERGLLGQHALFDPGVLTVPEPFATSQTQDEYEVRIKRDGTYTRVFYAFNPLDVVAWKGDLWPTKLNIKDFRPVTSPGYHLPPSVHATFQAGGHAAGQAAGMIISTFAPRPLETDPLALKVPFYHRNIDYDEVLFYHEGDFFSRSGIKPGALTLHPQGIHHGPHPAAVAASKTKTHTNEVAVMVESRHPFQVLLEAETVELKDYPLSWSQP